MRNKVAVIVGPTAVGKTDLSLEVAQRLGAEIVSIDSMQIYRGMDIGTAKPGAAALARVPHHLIDIRDPDHNVTVSEFQELARAAISDLSARGRLALLVGGAGLYVRAVLDDLQFPARSPEVRRSLEDEARAVGAEALHARLKELDPLAAAKIEPANERRTIRALEVIEITGRPFSENTSWERYESIYDVAIVGLDRDRDALYERIATRVTDMMERGLTEEVRGLGASLGTTARQALGYKQILDMPGASAAELHTEIVRATKRFARRQASWFKADPRVTWFDAAREDSADQVVDYFVKSLALPLGL